VSAATLLAALR